MSNVASFEKVDYTLRKRKQIERKIILDILSRLPSVSSYNYIGMGSVYYYDFILFHKFLNIKRMISIDDKLQKKRFDFNKPYSFIEFENTLTTDFLRQHDFSRKTIYWLDYDSCLCNFELRSVAQFILDDLEIIAVNAPRESVLIITIDITPPEKKEDISLFREYFSELLSTKYHNEKSFAGIKKFKNQYKYMIQDILLNELDDVGKYNPYQFRKLFSFSYKDTSPMYTIGLIKSDDGKFNDIMNRCEDIDFVDSHTDTLTSIDVPLLTYREKLYLDQQVHSIQKRLHRQKGAKHNYQRILSSLKFEIGSEELLKNYLKFYRYYPQYHEAIL